MYSIAETIVTNALSHLNPAFSSENQRASLQLEQIRNWDFSSVETALRAAFKHSQFRSMKFNLAHRVSVDGAGQYDEVPMRTFGGTSSLVAERWEDVYAELDIDGLLLDAEQAGVLANSYILGVWPDEDGDISVQRFLPHEVVEIDFGINIFGVNDVSKAKRVVLARALPHPSAMSISPWVVRIELTPEEAWIVLPDGVRRGIFDDDGSNPLGRVPLVGRRRALPVVSGTRTERTATWVPRVSEDVLSVQIGMVIGVSQAVGIAEAQTHAKVIATGDDAEGGKRMPARILDTPDNILYLPGNVNVTQLQLNPPIEKLIRSLETSMYYLSQMRYLRPEAYQASIVTGAARRADAEGFHSSQRRQERQCLTLERALCRLIGEVYDLTQRTALKLGEVDLHVEYRHVRSLENVLQEEQARTLRLANYMTDYVREIAREERVTEAEAQAILERRMAEAKGRLEEARPAGATPGLDELTAAGPVAEGAEAVQDTALNGAQVAALQSVVQAVSEGMLAPEAAKIALGRAFPGFSESDISRMVDSAAAHKAPEPSDQGEEVFGV